MRAVRGSDVESPNFLAAAWHPDGIEAQTFAKLQITIPQKFIDMAAEIHERRKMRPVVIRGVL